MKMFVLAAALIVFRDTHKLKVALQDATAHHKQNLLKMTSGARSVGDSQQPARGRGSASLTSPWPRQLSSQLG